jgi:predicted dehydrogenase
MNIAVVGCGYVAEFYTKTLGNYPKLKLVGAFDTNPLNLSSFSARWRVRAFDSLHQLLHRDDVALVLNLTNPRSHYEVTKACLESGKHVYSEKPLAMDFDSAGELAEMARQKGLYLASAPCSLLSESAQTLWKALQEDAIGKVRLVYANFDDGMIAPKLSPWNWRNESGVPWPAKDEFEVGCTYEHAGYVLTWLAAFFGPAKAVTSFASCQIPDKGIPVEKMAPDFTVGCIEYRDGVVARVTCSLVAPKDKSITIIGDDGILSVADVRNDVCPVYLQSTPPTGRDAGLEKRVNGLRRFLHVPGAEREWHIRRKIPLIREPPGRFASDSKPVDFSRGPAELVAAIREQRPCRLSARLGWHVVELIETLQHPERFGGRRTITSAFEPILPLTSQPLLPP